MLPSRLTSPQLAVTEIPSANDLLYSGLGPKGIEITPKDGITVFDWVDVIEKSSHILCR